MIVAAHLIRPDPHHRLGYHVRAAERGQIGGGVFSRSRVEITLAGDPRVAAVLAFGGLFEDDHLSAEIVGGDGRGDTRGTKPDNDDIGFHIPILLH